MKRDKISIWSTLTSFETLFLAMLTIIGIGVLYSIITLIG